MSYTPQPGSRAEKLLTALRRGGGDMSTAELARCAGVKCEEVHNNLATAVKRAAVDRRREGGEIRYRLAGQHPAPAAAEATPQIWNAWLNPAGSAPTATPAPEPQNTPAEPSNRAATAAEASGTTQPTQPATAPRSGRARRYPFHLTRKGMLTIDDPAAGIAVLTPQLTAELIRFLIKSARTVDAAFANRVLP